MVSLNHSLERLLLREINVVAMGSFMLHFFKFYVIELCLLVLGFLFAPVAICCDGILKSDHKMSPTLL
jgi:hypothetical protein